MNAFFASSATAGFVLSLLSYELGVWIRKKTRSDLANPLLISIALCILFLLATGVEVEQYQKSAGYLSYFLTPATVALAIPLYKQLELLKGNLKAILLGVLSGTLASLATVLVLCLVLRLGHETYVTLLPKSITTAIGLGVSRELGGNETITVAMIIITGVQGNILARGMARLLKIKSPVARGLMIGTASHAIGTAKAMEMGEVEGAMSSLAIVVAGLMTVVGASVFAMFY